MPGNGQLWESFHFCKEIDMLKRVFGMVTLTFWLSFAGTYLWVGFEKADLLLRQNLGSILLLIIVLLALFSFVDILVQGSKKR